MAEFAIVAPVLFVVIAGIIQFGLIFWSQQTLTQIARDTGRWAATQASCDGSSAQVTQVANDIAGQSTLFGYSTDLWANGGTQPTNKVVVSWPRDTGQPCPPASNQDEAWVRVEIDHQVPIFFPFVPGEGQLTTTAEFRMEPEPV
ncbi:MAG: TadE/TadG family type IV pilus assembly protein [Chloroflexota bacterium]|jgi:Flp pilus assembly protein TadG